MRPDVDDLVIPLAAGDDPFAVLILDFIDFLTGTLDNIRLLFLVESYRRERMEYRSAETGRIECDEFCDKPLDRLD